MSPSNRSNTIWLFLFLCATVTICQDVEQTLEIPEDSEDESTIWMEYEFGTGAGNREELIVTNISVREYTNVPKTARNWQFLEVNGTNYLFRNEKSTLFCNKLDLDKGTIVEFTRLIVKGTILKFKAIEMKSNIVIVLCVQLNTGILLECHALLDGNSFQYLGSLPVLKHVKDIEIITKLSDNEEPYKIFVLNEEEFFLQLQNSIDVYGFDIDFSTNALNFWFYHSTYVPRSFDIQVFNIYETVSLALQGANDVFLYEYKNIMEGNDILQRQTIKSYNLNNFICFESGYLQFLSISGPEAGLFLFEDGEFQFNTESESSFDVSDISWVTSVQLDTYRDESMLLVQLKNSTVFALGWQGSSFKNVQLPNNDLDRFDLSMITPIPKYGFIAGNRVVKFDTRLKSVKHPLQYETEKLIRLQRSLNELIQYEEKIINETKARLNESKIENPVITGFWNISRVNATNVIISDNVTFESITLGESKLTKEDLKFDVNIFEMKLREAERKLDEIDSRLNEAGSNDFDSKDLRFDSYVEINGDIYVNGSLYTDKLTVSSINGINATLPSDNYTIDFKDVKNLTIKSINGIPVENIRFGDSMVDYSSVDFDKINRAEIRGDLSFSTINGLDWETLMKNIVWKDRDMLIPGETVIEGTVTSNNVELFTLNDLLYPEQYVLENGSSPYVTVTGSKTFESFEASELEDASTLNGIDFDDYVILSKENVLKEGISFENLTVTDELVLDCEIEGLNMEDRLLLNETNKISSNILFYNLNVSGNITFDRLIINNTEVDLGDLLLKTDENVVITGTKTFLKNVEMRSNVTITSGMINGHHVDEFVTLDTDQVFPNLRKISANVTFGNVTLGAMKKLEKFFRENNSTGCLNRTVIFESPVTVEELTFDKLNNNVSYEFFTRKVNETFGNASFENLTVDTLIADEIVPNMVNGLDLVDYAKHLESSDIECTIEDSLETDRLCAKSVNGMPVEEIGQLKDRLSAILDHVQSGNLTLNSLRVLGTIKADSINGERVTDLYNEERFGPRPVIVKDEVYIEDLTILGLMNGYNFTERVLDTVQKSDANIVIEGHKTFDSIICTELEAKYLNGRPIENILDPYKEQVLSGPVIVNGTMTVSEYFNATGNINGVPYRELTDKFRYLGNNSYEFRGDVRFLDDVTIENLYVNGSIQGTDFDDFLNTVIYKDEDNVTVSGTKIFENTVTFNDGFFVHEKLNDIDLRRFREKAVYIDAPFSVKSKIIFKDGIKVEKDIVVKKSLEAKSIMGIDIEELRANVLYLNRPTYVDGNLTFTNVTFESNVQVKKINDVDMDLVIPLKTDQFIPVKVLRGYNITAENMEILGTVNGVDLREMQEKTFMLTGDQNITGHFTFHGVVHFRNEFNPRLINGIDPNRFIPLNTKSTIVGNFVFEKPVILKKSLRLLGYLNDIDVNRWEAVAVTTENSMPQFISGNWTVFGNVYFQNGAYGSEILNGTNITEVSSILAEKHLEMEAMLEEKNANLDVICKDLAELKRYAENQIYQFNAFDYLQIIEFDNGSIASVHYFETNDTDHLILSCYDCQMHAYAFTEEKFELVGDMPNFGVVQEWATFERDQVLYFLTSGPKSCGRNPVNVWRLKDNEFRHVLDLDHNVKVKKINQDIFFTMIDKKKELRSKKMNEQLKRFLSSSVDNDETKIVWDEDILAVNKTTGKEYDNNTSSRSVKEILNFKAGFLEREMLLYYDEEFSKDSIFIFHNDTTQKKIFQTITAYRPTSFTILNFDGLVETLLVYVENRKNLRIYEYKGKRIDAIKNFTDEIQMDDEVNSAPVRNVTHALLTQTHYDLFQRIPSCPVKSPQPLKEFVGRCQTMPSRVKKSFCGCLQDDEPPEITYCVVEHTGTLTLQAMTPTLPMPAEEELNKMFLELVDELDLTQANRQAVLALPANKKWQIYCSRKGNGTLENGGLRTTDLSGDPEDYINRLRTIASSPFPEEGEEVSNQMRQTEALKTALRTQPHSFVLRFIELDGLNALLQVLGTMDAEAANSNLHTSVIGCLKALMNNSNGRAHVLAHPTAINTISQSLATENIKTKISVLEILGAVCLVPGGHRKVLEAMLHFQQYHSERTRFQSIINDLDKNFGIYKDNLSLKTAIMSFINAVLNYGPGQVTLEFRLHLRYELLMLGIQPIIEKLRKYENETLDRHLDFFEMVRNEDEKELARKFEKEHVDTKSATAMFDLLRRKLSHTAAYPHLLSLLEHCLLLPLDYGSHPQHWLLFDRIVQQIVLQSEGNDTGVTRNPDVAPIEINVKEIVHLLAKEEELVAARKKAEELERENSDMSTRLAKKEQELDLRTQEKEDIEASLARVKERLEKETSMHIETKQRISELQDNLETLSRQINNEKSERKRLEQLVASGSLPDDAKATIKIVEDEVLEKVEAKPMPPPPPPPPLAPPPPPCLMPTAPPPMKVEIIKNVPQPSNPLKSFNWSKIPEQKLQGTIWSELDDTKLYNVMDLESIDKIFCAYQKNGVSAEGSIEDLRTLGKNKKTMSVIDSRRAQNCTILLSKLKMSDNEITRTILSMDQQNILHIDMVEQLLKYIPSSEEAALLDMHQKELQSRADCFLYQISKVPHYEQRLRSLHYKKKFAASIAELTPRMRAVLEASRQVARSRRLRKLLELVLALGNYVNRGNARGNACGFRLASLNRLVDTKSSCSKGTTLLHYLVQILESRFREVLDIEEDMPHVRTAARVSMADLQKEVANLKNGLQDVQREIEFHRGQSQVLQGDMFLPAMRDFQAQATCRLAEAEDLFQDMKTRFDRAVRLFGEDSAGVQPDEFFGIFENFLQALAEARQDVENMRKKIEEEERRAKQEQELRKRTMERKNSREGILNSISLSKKNEANSNGQNDNKGEFDDLISALRTGDVFGEDIAKFKRSKRRPVTPSGQESRRHSAHREDSRERH